ncbi:MULTISPECIES: OmpA family protein [unclassified Marinobacter]|uniref:OmpA family protein n=1 Tax=unclassified Marinobacter TaxID=83889 RepID=UPI0026E39C0E|nr:MULTISPECIES: OmpA family protein [unclassified Marinobacter]MDO6444072.1 OmpA family protein [Marinobacter sp. 2_MG-2023]MDO6824017.1 OmpA family protein [Marinobacter sp. 1_MG-2023]
MNKRNITLGVAVGLSVLVAGCSSTPTENAMVDEARASYTKIKDDPDVARSGDRQLRSARDELSRAESLLEDGKDTVLIEHAAYLANRHAQIASEQGERARLQEEIDSAEERRRELMLNQRSSEAEQARKEAEMLRQRMEELQAERTDRGMVLTLGDVLFDLNKADLKSSGERTIGRLAQFMREYEDRRVSVEGYTDSTGEESYNQQLSERRAEAVRDELISQGIERRRIETRGYGEQYPVAGNDTSSGRQQNRRVEIVISDEDGQIETRQD